MSRPTADALVLHFLYMVREAHLDRIARYMDSQWGHPRGTTRNALWRLVNAGMVERIGYMRYRRPRMVIVWSEDEPDDGREPEALNTTPAR
jgi:hypothetical protein